jgi:glycosyltransferase involved in cell wall biosynthesis
MKAKRVAFPLRPCAAWTGGYNYLVNLFRALESFQSGLITPVLFCGDDALEEDVSTFSSISNIEIVRSPVFNAGCLRNRMANAILTGIDSDALRLFQKEHIDVVFENAVYFGWRFPIPVIAWMPDFQHRRMKHLFGKLAYWKRELGFRAQVASGRYLMLSSEDARRDCELFYPSARGRTAVVRFSAPISANLMVENPAAVIDEYRLPAHFVYLPNQFWRHKNHALVIEALDLLKKKGVDLVVVTTGNPLDPRSPGYYEDLISRINQLGLQDNFRILGMVPRQHVISLMRICSALLNPSFFEGWSSTVEEAKSLGVPMLLSEIGVHREQIGEGATYFDPQDATMLSNKLFEFSLHSPAQNEVARQVSANSGQYVSDFARDFTSLVKISTNY